MAQEPAACKGGTLLHAMIRTRAHTSGRATCSSVYMHACIYHDVAVPSICRVKFVAAHSLSDSRHDSVDVDFAGPGARDYN